MGRYIPDKDVEIRLLGKVRFTDDPVEENLFQRSLLRDLVAQAEAQVEVDLSPRYLAPFQNDSGAPFSQFPTLAKTTPQLYAAYNMIRELMLGQAVMRVLDSDFGRGTVANGEKYLERLQAKYKSLIEDKLLAKKKVGSMETSQWQFPPLPSLALNYMNTAADDGYAGMVLTTNIVKPQNPYYQTNDPSENFWNGVLDVPWEEGGGSGF